MEKHNRLSCIYRKGKETNKKKNNYQFGLHSRDVTRCAVHGENGSLEKKNRFMSIFNVTKYLY